MSGPDRDRTRSPYPVEIVDRPTEPLLRRLRSGMALGGLVIALGCLAALAAIIAVVVALALATTATS